MTYNEEPRPRVLFIGFEEEDLQGKGILELFPTTRIIDSEELTELHQGEYDIAITHNEHNLSGLEPHLYIVALGGTNLGTQKDGERTGVLKAVHNSSVAKELRLGDAVENDERLKSLIEQTLLPIYTKQTSHSTLYSAYRTHHVGGYNDRPANLWSTTLADRDDKTLAGFAKRNVGSNIKAELWFLSGSLSFKVLKQWLEYLIDRWSVTDSATFPNKTTWKKAPEWQTVEENSIDDSIDSLKKEHEEAIKAYEEQLSSLKESKHEASVIADKSLRALLTSQGDTLKNAVYSTLVSLGFEVADVDRELEDSGGDSKADKLEDLRAKKSQWISLIEVRGYSKGAKVNDLLRLNRFTKRYMQENGGTPPDAVWYVVNHDFRTDPSTRNTALKASPSEVKEFGKDQGLVIDTVELFRLKKLVDAGTISTVNARKQLMSSSGYFKASKS